MSYMKLTDTVAVAGQISAEQVGEIAAAGLSGSGSASSSSTA